MPSGPDKHLYIVVTEADNDGMHVLVNVTSIDPDVSHDQTCVLGKDDHPFITHPSYIAYSFAIERRTNHVDDFAADGRWTRHKDASPELIEKICAGIKKSGFTRRAIKDSFDRCVRHAEQRKKNAKS